MTSRMTNRRTEARKRKLIATLPLALLRENLGHLCHMRGFDQLFLFSYPSPPVAQILPDCKAKTSSKVSSGLYKTQHFPASGALGSVLCTEGKRCPVSRSWAWGGSVVRADALSLSTLSDGHLCPLAAASLPVHGMWGCLKYGVHGRGPGPGSESITIRSPQAGHHPGIPAECTTASHPTKSPGSGIEEETEMSMGSETEGAGFPACNQG